MNSLISYRIAAAIIAVGVISSSPLRALEVNHFPDDTELVVVVDLKQILNCEMIKAQPDAVGELKTLLGSLAGVDTLQMYLKEAGLDAFRDLTRISYVYTGKSPQVSFLRLEGVFDADKLAAAARRNPETFRVKKRASVICYEIAPRGERHFHAAMLSPSKMIAAASEESLADALARAAGKKKSGLKQELRKMLESAQGQQSISFVSTGAAIAHTAKTRSIPNGDNAAALLHTLDALSGGITLAKGIQFQCIVNAASEDAAKKLTESCNGALRILLTHARQTAARDAAFLPVVDVVKGLKFTNQGQEIRFRGEVNLDTVELLMKNFPPNRLPKDRK